MHYPKIAALVKKARAEKDISLRELAALTARFTEDKKPLSHQQILRVERGEGSLDASRVVLRALEVPKVKAARTFSGAVYQWAMAAG